MPDMLMNQTEDRDTLGGRISRAREAMDMTSAELARNVGVTRKTIDGWQTDALEPRSNRLASLAGVLGVSPTWLLQGIGSAPRGEVEADELRVLKAQMEQMETSAGELLNAIDQVKRSIESLAAARE